MSKLVKEMVTEQLRTRYADVESAVWVEVVGVDGNTTNAMRRDLNEKSMRIEVIKNSLLRRAVGEGPLAPLAAAMCGPAALVTGGESAIDAAKAIEEWIGKLQDKVRLRGALLEGEYLDESRVAGLAKMPTKRDLQAKVVGCFLSPGSNLAGAMLAGGGNIAGCLKAMIEKLEDGETIERKSA